MVVVLRLHEQRVVQLPPQAIVNAETHLRDSLGHSLHQFLVLQHDLILHLVHKHIAKRLESSCVHKLLRIVSENIQVTAHYSLDQCRTLVLAIREEQQRRIILQLANVTSIE